MSNLLMILHHQIYLIHTLHDIYFCDPENIASTVLSPGDIVPETLHHYHQYS